MNRELLHNVEKYNTKNRRKKTWQKLVSILGCIVVFCTTYVLVLPAITQEKETFCGSEKHVHSDECYGYAEEATESQPILVCSLENEGFHVHSDECWDRIKGHKHDDTCWEYEKGALICGLNEEEAHAHIDTCYSDELICSEGNHEHVETCWEKKLQCTLSESGHVHDNNCFEQIAHLICTEDEVPDEEVLVCDVAEELVHEHTADCYEAVKSTPEEKILICELEEHEHKLACYSDPAADVENAVMWEKTFEDVELSGILADDVLAIAESQIGYRESEKNYAVMADGESIKGYTRYGDWYGDLYGDWCAMFVSFCLHYAEGVDMPLDSNCQNWIGQLTEMELYHEVIPADGEAAAEDAEVITLSSETEAVLKESEEPYLPSPGDIIFFDWDEDGHSDHVGLVKELTEVVVEEETSIDEAGSTAYTELPEEEPETTYVITTIEGNAGNRVTEKEYDFSDPTIMGYAELLDTDAEEDVQTVIDLIDLLPDVETVETTLAELEEPEDWDGYEEYTRSFASIALEAYELYESMDEEQQAQVTNIDKLFDLEPYWSMITLEEPIDIADSDCYCGYMAHSHSHENGCYTLNCTAEEHIHTAEDNCFDENGEVVCEHDVHEHSDACYTLDCAKYEHSHVSSCAVEPEEVVQDMNSVSGVYYHPEKSKYYQLSSVRTNNGIENIFNFTFVLVPEDVYEENPGWDAADAYPRLWTAKRDSNYLVAYCAEPFTGYSTDKEEDYDTFVIDNSRFSGEVQDKVSAIISHGYPYLTYEEMRAELAAAYKAGDIEHDVANCQYCTEHEYMTAVQTAIWSTVSPTIPYDTFNTISVDATATSGKYINPFQAGYSGHFSNEEQLDEHVITIRNWLLGLSEPAELSVTGYDYEVSENTNGTYSLTVNAAFNRAIIAGEIVSMEMNAGNYKTSEVVLDAGDTAFSVSMTNLTEEELLSAEISLGVSGKRLQAYFFDSDTYQDFVSGIWESYENDLSFRLGSDITDVAVTKTWLPDKPEGDLEVAVQLYADGEASGEPIILSEKNNWTYVWSDLRKNTVLGEEIIYTVQELPVDGYYSTVEEVEGEDIVLQIDTWVEVDSFEENGKYMITGINGVLGIHGTGTPSLTWENINESAYETPDMVIWTASDIDGNGGAILTSEAYPDNPMGFITNGNYIFPAGSESSISTHIYYDNSGHLYVINDSDEMRYASHLYDSGEYRTSASAESAEQLTLYKLETVEVPSASKTFVICNTKLNNIEPINISVTKSWQGRPDDTYPESVDVQLVQNGYPYGNPVSLNADNAWSYTWENVPKADDKGTAFVYTVEEIDSTGYTASIDTVAEENLISISIVNEWTPDVEIQLRKEDYAASGNYLAGAEFDLYLATNNIGDPIPGASDANGIFLQHIVTGEDGTTEIAGLMSNEVYYLVEIKAPSGYNLLDSPISFTVSKGENGVALILLEGENWTEAEGGEIAVLTVKNKAGYQMPETGGIGTTIFYVLGGLMVVGAGVLLVAKKRMDK